MTPDDFEFISQLLKKRSGLALTQDKIYLLESRLTPLARTHDCPDFTAFIRKMRFAPDEKVIAEVVDAMTTNESMFFRDQKPFDQLRQLSCRAQGKKRAMARMKVWSAACSNGRNLIPSRCACWRSV